MIYALLGIAFGLIGGMGFGGGIVLIPALVLIMGKDQLGAQGMTLFAYLPMAACALFLHITKKRIRVVPTVTIAIFGCIGGIAGYLTASVIAANVLRIIFGLFLVVTALVRIWRHELSKKVK